MSKRTGGFEARRTSVCLVVQGEFVNFGFILVTHPLGSDPQRTMIIYRKDCLNIFRLINRQPAEDIQSDPSVTKVVSRTNNKIDDFLENTTSRCIV